MNKIIFTILMIGVAITSFGQNKIAALDALMVVGGDSIRTEYPRTQFYAFGKIKEFETKEINNSHFYQPLSSNWKYRLFNSSAQLDDSMIMPSFDDSSWEEYNIAEGKNLLSVGGIAGYNGKFSVRLPSENPATIYRSTFKVPLTWDERQIFVSIGHLAGSSEIFINGIRMGFNEDSKAMADYDITPACKEGLNSIAIVSYAYGSGSYLESDDHFSGAQIGGDVVVWSAPKLQLRDYIINTTYDPTYTNGMLEFGALICTHYMNDHEVRLFFELLDPKGDVVDSQSKYSELNMRTEDTVYFNVPIKKVKQWSATDPNLYTIRLKVQREMRFTEFIEIPVGFRSVDIKNNELLINGEKSYIKGVKLRQSDIPKQSDMVHLFLKDLKAKGVNSLWITGPQSETFYRAADSEGIYIFSAANINALSQGKTLRYGLDNQREMVGKYLSRQEANYEVSKSHASVISFALGEDGSNGYNMYESYILLEDKLPLRPIIYKGAGDEWNSDIYLADNMSAREVKNYSSTNNNPVIMMLDNGANFKKLWGEIENNRFFNGVIFNNLSMVDNNEVRDSFKEFDVEFVGDRLKILNFTKDEINDYDVEYVLNDKNGVKLTSGKFNINILKADDNFEFIVDKSADKKIGIDAQEMTVDIKLFQRVSHAEVVLKNSKGVVKMRRTVVNVKDK